jgi:hypothetical protein
MTAELVQPNKGGRPKGARSALPMLRAARWALRHLADEGAAAPPNAGAAMMLAMARQRPEQFAVTLDRLEAQDRAAKGQMAAGLAQAVAMLSGANGAMPADRRARNLTLTMKEVVQLLNGSALSWIERLPERFRVVEVVVRRRASFLWVVVTIHSEDLTPHEEGQGIPEWKPVNYLAWK